MAFHEIDFPLAIAYGSSGGPVRKTEIVVLDSGFEQRNTPWSASRHKYNIAGGVKTYDDLHDLKAFWEARNGPLNGFRYKDWSDYKSCAPQQTPTNIDQTIGTGDGINPDFQLIKIYTSGSYSSQRTISKPKSGTVLVSLDNVNQSSGWTLDYTTGILTFIIPPALGQVVKVGFEFNVPVRFEADQLSINLEYFERGGLEDIILTELRV